MKQKISDQKMPEKPKTKESGKQVYKSFMEEQGSNLSAFLYV